MKGQVAFLLLAFCLAFVWTQECPNGEPVAMCFSNPCRKATCPADPEATCRVNFCGTKACTAEFFRDDKEVNCYRICPPYMAVALCANDACEGAVCPAFPEAECGVNYCGPMACKAQFYIDNYLVDCKRRSPNIVALLTKSTGFDQI